jgi:hypothetical protein
MMSQEIIDIEMAKQIASAFLGEPKAPADYSFVILDEYTIEKPKCFVFFYESSKHLATDKFEDRLVGNAPVLIDRVSKEPTFLGTAQPVEVYIEEYEATH